MASFKDSDLRAPGEVVRGAGDVAVAILDPSRHRRPRIGHQAFHRARPGGEAIPHPVTLGGMDATAVGFDMLAQPGAACAPRSSD